MPTLERAASPPLKASTLLLLLITSAMTGLNDVTPIPRLTKTNQPNPMTKKLDLQPSKLRPQINPKPELKENLKEQTEEIGLERQKCKNGLPQTERVLRHIFHLKENKSLDISHLWNYHMSGLVYRDGKQLSSGELAAQVELRRNIKLEIMPVRMRLFPENFILNFENHMEVYYSNSPDQSAFRMFRRIFQNDSIKRDSARSFMRTFEKTKCLTRAVYRQEVWMLCVRRVPGFDFHSATENEVLLLLRCPYTKQSCKEYTFNYGAQAYFLWVFKRFFGLFHKNCQFKINDSRSTLIQLLQKHKLIGKNIDVQSSIGVSKSPFIDQFETKDVQNFFESNDKGAGQIFDHCLLSHIKIMRSGPGSVGLSFTQPQVVGMIYVNFMLDHEIGLVDAPSEKEASFLSEPIDKLLHLDFGLVIIIKTNGFLVLPENTFVGYLSRHTLEEVSHLFKSGRKYLCFYLDRNNFKLFVYSVSQKEHIERVEYNVTSLGKVAYYGKILLFENDLMADFFLFVHRVKTLVIYGLKSQKINEKRIKICVDFSQKLPISRNCGFFKWVRVSSFETISKLDVVFFEHKNSVVLFFDGNFVTISYKEPLYEVIIKKHDFRKEELSTHKAIEKDPRLPQSRISRVVQELDRSGKQQETGLSNNEKSPFRKSSPFGPQPDSSLLTQTKNAKNNQGKQKSPNNLKNVFQKAVHDVINISQQNHQHKVNILAEYDIYMASEREINRVRVNLEITRENNPIWLSDMDCDGLVKQIMIDKSVTPVPNLRGNFLSLFDTYFELKFVSRRSLSLSLPPPLRGTKPQSKKEKKIRFQNLEKSPKGSLNISPMGQKGIQRMIFFEKRSGKTKRQFYVFIKTKNDKDFYMAQFDEHLERSRVRVMNVPKARFIGSIFKRELLFYNGENFYSRSSDFEHFGMNLNMLKIRCERVFLFDYDEGLSILFCLKKGTVHSFLRSRDNLTFEGPIITRCDRLFLFGDSSFNGVRSLGRFSKKIVLKTKSKRGVNNLALFHIKIERSAGGSSDPHNTESKSKLRARLEAESGRKAHFLEENILFQDLNPIKKEVESEDEAPRNSGEGQKKVVLIEHFAEWDLDDIVISLLGTKEFAIINAIAMEQRLFLIVESEHHGSIGINFGITESGALELIYKLTFQNILGAQEPIKVLGVIDRMEFPTSEFSKSLILLKVLFRSHLHVLHFHPERSLLTAFPLISKEKALNSMFTACPINLFDAQNSGPSNQNRGPNQLTFFFVQINGPHLIKIEKNSVRPEPFFQLKIDTFKNKRIIEVSSRNDSRKLKFRVWRFEDGQTNHLHFNNDSLRPGIIQLKHSSKFPLEIAIDLSNVRGNIFKYQLQSENHFDVQSGVLQLKPMLVEIPLFVAKSRSLTSNSRVSLNQKARLVYMYNKDLIWVNNHHGRLVAKFYINRYVTCSSRLLQEFGNTITKEDVFFDAENSLLIRVLRSKSLSALIIARFEAPLDPCHPSELRETESIELQAESIARGAPRHLVVNEKLLPENYLSFDFDYQETMLIMSSQGDTSRNISLYYYENLIRDQDCPVSFSIVDQESFKFKVIQSVIFSKRFHAGDVRQMGGMVWDKQTVNEIDISPIIPGETFHFGSDNIRKSEIGSLPVGLNSMEDNLSFLFGDSNSRVKDPVSPEIHSFKLSPLIKPKLRRFPGQKAFSQLSESLKSPPREDDPQDLKPRLRVAKQNRRHKLSRVNQSLVNYLVDETSKLQERILTKKYNRLQIPNKEEGYIADQDDDIYEIEKELLPKPKSSRKRIRTSKRKLKAEFEAVKQNRKLEKEKVLIVARVLDAVLKLDFYIMSNDCFVFRSTQKVELHVLLGNVEVARVEILIRNDRVSIILLSTNYHHFVVELSFLKINQILKVDLKPQPPGHRHVVSDSENKKSDIEKIESDLINFISLKGYTDIVLQKQTTNSPLHNLHEIITDNPGKLKKHTQNFLADTDDLNTLLRLKKRGEDMIQSSSFLERLAGELDMSKTLKKSKSDILRRSDTTPLTKNLFKIGPSGGSEIDYLNHQGRQSRMTNTSLKASMSQNPRAQSNFRIKNTSGAFQKMREKQSVNAAKFREKYGNTQDLQRLIKMYSSSLQNVEDELKNLTNLSADAYFLNNPFQINKDANSIKLAYMRGILLVIEKVEGLTKVLVYDLNRSHEVFKTDKAQSFSPQNSVGTAYMHQLQHPLCQSESESLQIMDFFQSVDHFEFMLLCDRKVFLFDGESELSSQVLLLRVPKVFSLIIESPLINSKFFKIGFRNPHHLIFKKLILENEDLVNIQISYTSLRFIMLFTFVVGYCLVIWYLVNGCGRSKEKHRHKSKKEKVRSGEEEKGIEGMAEDLLEGERDSSDGSDGENEDDEGEREAEGEEEGIEFEGYGRSGARSGMGSHVGSEDEGERDSDSDGEMGVNDSEVESELADLLRKKNA